MFVVHGWWSRPATSADGGSLTLWAESAASPPAPRPRSARRPKVRDHPFVLDAERLADLLGVRVTNPEDPHPVDADLVDADLAAVIAGADLSLPTYSNAPSASPELLDLRSITDDSAEGETVRLRSDLRWRVPTVSLGPADALRLLRWIAGLDAEAGPDGVTEGPGGAGVPFRIAPDLRRLLGLAAFAQDLAGRGRVLPIALAAGPDQGVARWRPVLTGADADWFRTTVATLPPSYAAGLEVADFGRQAGLSLAAGLDALVDAVVRARMAPQMRGGRAGPSRVVPSRVVPSRAGRNGVAGWRRALQEDDALFQAGEAQLRRILADLADWQVDATDAGSVRACFRLVEPTDDDPASVVRRADAPERDAWESEHWWLEFGLQMADEPSVFVPAADIWSAGSRPAGNDGPRPPGPPKRPSNRALTQAVRKAAARRTGTLPPIDPVDAGLTLLKRHTAQPVETLLAELGRALRLFPMLARALSGRRPQELMFTNTDEAHAFLARTAPLLIGAGFGVQLPGWWSSPKSRIGARLNATTPSQPGRVDAPSQVGQLGLVEFRWQLAVGDQALTVAEVEELIETGSPLVKLRGQWMQVDPDRLRRARAFLRRRSAAGMSVSEVLQVLSSTDEGPGGLPVTAVEAHGWLGDLLAPSTEQRLVPVPAPKGFEGTLRPYQERGVAWLSFLESIGLGGLLADDMGLGKTIQLLALISHDLENVRAAMEPEADGPTEPTLLICPTSLVGNWQREAAKFTPGLRIHVHHGKERPQGQDFRDAVASNDLVITTYSLLARDAGMLRALSWRRVVLDEAQAVKNAATQAAIAARALRAPRRIAVTGTPVENRLADLWSLMEFANPRLLGSAGDFKQRFALPIERHADEAAGERLRALTQPFMLRRVKTDKSIITDLPDKFEQDVVCSLTAEQAALYQNVVSDMLRRIYGAEGIERRGLVIATMTKLKQVCNHPAQYLRDGSRIAGRSGKLARLEETLEEVLAAGEKALLFTQYAEFGEMLRTHLTARFGREVIFLHGGASRTERDDLVARFQAEDGSGPPIFVLSLKAGGTGLTLTAATQVIHVDRWWNPAVEDQATDRAFRIGQTRAVQVRKFVTAGTLEEKIADMIAGKRGLAANVVGTGEGWLTELSTSALRDLFTLDPAVVGE